MSKYEISVSFSYVPSWTFIEAVREIFQNALDEEKLNSNCMYFNYSEEEETLYIGNKDSKLGKETLLIGSSTKSGNNDAIGEHGEGYKLATMVLLRDGCGVKVYNNYTNETWTAKRVKSKRYNTDIPVFNIEKSLIRKVESHNLVFEISNFNRDMFDKVVSSNLHLLKKKRSLKMYETSEGDVLLDEDQKGRIYVSGLYVCTKSGITYGYNFNPNLVRLDRDRKLLDYIDLIWNTSLLIKSVDDIEFIISSINLPDARYIHSSYAYKEVDKIKKVSDSIAEDFIETNGSDSIPCKDNESFNEVVKEGYKPIMVSEPVYECIKKSTVYSSSSTVKLPTLKEKLLSWCDEVYEVLDDDTLVKKGKELIKQVCNLI